MSHSRKITSFIKKKASGDTSLTGTALKNKTLDDRNSWT